MPHIEIEKLNGEWYKKNGARMRTWKRNIQMQAKLFIIISYY